MLCYMRGCLLAGSLGAEGHMGEKALRGLRIAARSIVIVLSLVWLWLWQYASG